MDTMYYLGVVLLTFAGLFYSAFSISRYFQIKKHGETVPAEILEYTLTPSARPKRVIYLKVLFTYENQTYTASCSVKRSSSYTPTVGDSEMLRYLPGKNKRLYPIMLREYTTVLITLFIALVSLLLLGSLISALVSMVSF